MEPNLTSVMHDWHDFYGLVGAASATLVGLMFVAASIGAGAVVANQQEQMKMFVTPTVVHFSTVLFICILMLIPTLTWLSLSMVLGWLGVIGLAYSMRQWVRVFSTLGSQIDLADRMFYVFIPSIGYLVVIASAGTLLAYRPLSADLVPVALVALLVAGIRNAWDTTLWITMHSRTQA